jgi:hypothetical protein
MLVNLITLKQLFLNTFHLIKVVNSVSQVPLPKGPLAFSFSSIIILIGVGEKKEQASWRE